MHKTDPPQLQEVIESRTLGERPSARLWSLRRIRKRSWRPRQGSRPEKLPWSTRRVPQGFTSLRSQGGGLEKGSERRSRGTKQQPRLSFRDCPSRGSSSTTPWKWTQAWGFLLRPLRSCRRQPNVWWPRSSRTQTSLPITPVASLWCQRMCSSACASVGCSEAVHCD